MHGQQPTCSRLTYVVIKRAPNLRAVCLVCAVRINDNLANDTVFFGAE